MILIYARQSGDRLSSMIIESERTETAACRRSWFATTGSGAVGCPKSFKCQLFLAVFTSKMAIRRTTLVLLQFGQRIGFIFFWYWPKENISSKLRSHFRQ